jgi:rhamnose transport system permease protein
MGTGYEMEVLAMVILGGVSATGGKGRAVGVILAIFIIGLLRFGLGMANISAEVIMIVLGALLIVAVAIPNFRRFLQESNWFVKLQQLIANKK